MERSIDRWLEDVPDLLLTLADGLTQSPRVLCAEHRAIRVVVDRHIMRPPPQERFASRKRVIIRSAGDHVPAGPSGGDMGERIRAFNWSKTPSGEPSR